MQAFETRHPSLVDRLVRHAFERITTGEWAGGRRFTEDELAADFGVSRTPVREAVRRLAAMGLLVVHPRRRAALEVVSVTQADLAQISQVREAIECMAVRLAMPRITAADRDVLSSLADQCRQALDRNPDDRMAVFAADSEFHLALAVMSGNHYLEQMLRQLDAKVQLCRMLLCRSIDKVRAGVAYHRQIVKAIVAGDAALAERRMRSHVASMLEAS